MKESTFFYDGRPNAHFDPHSVFQLLDLLNTFCSSQSLYSLRTLWYQICCTRGLCSWHEIGIMSEYILHTGETMDKPWSPPKFFESLKELPYTACGCIHQSNACLFLIVECWWWPTLIYAAWKSSSAIQWNCSKCIWRNWKTLARSIWLSFVLFQS